MAPLKRFEISGSELIEADEKVALLFEKVGYGSSLSVLMAIRQR